jgi:hypothetical protein
MSSLPANQQSREVLLERLKNLLIPMQLSSRFSLIEFFPWPEPTNEEYMSDESKTQDPEGNHVDLYEHQVIATNDPREIISEFEDHFAHIMYVSSDEYQQFVQSIEDHFVVFENDSFNYIDTEALVNWPTPLREKALADKQLAEEEGDNNSSCLYMIVEQTAENIQDINEFRNLMTELAATYDLQEMDVLD